MVDEHRFLLYVMKLLLGFVESDGIMLVLHVLNDFITCSCIILFSVLCCAYHVFDKMSIYVH